MLFRSSVEDDLFAPSGEGHRNDEGLAVVDETHMGHEAGVEDGIADGRISDGPLRQAVDAGAGGASGGSRGHTPS